MSERTRTTQKLAQRIDRDYFKRRFPMPAWRWRLSLLLPVFGVLWLGWHALARDERVYTSGPITPSHSMFAAKCIVCHASNGGFTKAVHDQACSACHDGPVHNVQQTSNPACASCHIEHNGDVHLKNISDANCTACHARLTTKTGKPTIAAAVDSLAHHPDFRAQPDPGTIKLNHKVHLASNLRGPHGTVQLKCVDCHRVSPEGAYMLPVKYAGACSACHPLQFDPRISDQAPHKETPVVHDYVVRALQSYIAAHPNALNDRAEIRVPGRPPEPRAANSSSWVTLRVAEAEKLLWGKTCKECHALNFEPATGIPAVAKANVKIRWLERGEFEHRAHGFAGCTFCHKSAAVSTKTSDVLLPGVKVCQQCHREDEQAAGSQCVECHVYHDWSKERTVEGKWPLTE